MKPQDNLKRLCYVRLKSALDAPPSTMRLSASVKFDDLAVSFSGAHCSMAEGDTSGRQMGKKVLIVCYNLGFVTRYDAIEGNASSVSCTKTSHERRERRIVKERKKGRNHQTPGGRHDLNHQSQCSQSSSHLLNDHRAWRYHATHHAIIESHLLP